MESGGSAGPDTAMEKVGTSIHHVEQLPEKREAAVKAHR